MDGKSESKCSASIIFEFSSTACNMFEFDHWPETQVMLNGSEEALDLIQTKRADKIHDVGENYTNQYIDIIRERLQFI